MGCRNKLPSFLTFLCILSTTSKYEYWFPFQSKESFADISTHTCNATLQAYHGARGTGHSYPGKKEKKSCTRQFACVLQNLPLDVSRRMGSASLLLGLTPGLLASVSPTVAEISLLCIERPILAMFLALGSPAVFPSRVLTYESALTILKEDGSYDPAILTRLRKSNFLFLLSVAEYLLALASIANVACNSYLLGMRTVLVWACVTWYLPLVWTFLPYVIHGPSAVAFYSWPKWREWRNDNASRRCWLDPRGETDLCLTRHESARRWEKRVEPTIWTIFWNYVATVLGFLHVAFGIVLYSSLLFIDITDAVYVVGRYLASTAICRCILKFEISSMRKLYREEKQKKAGPPAWELQAVDERVRRGNSNERDTSRLMVNGTP